MQMSCGTNEKSFSTGFRTEQWEHLDSHVGRRGASVGHAGRHFDDHRHQMPPVNT